MERSIFLTAMKIGKAATEYYSAGKGTGDAGPDLKTGDGKVLNRESVPGERDCFSVFGKFRICRTCYRRKGEKGLMPLEASANLAGSCCSYLLQEWMNALCVRDSSGQSSVLPGKLSGLKVYPDRFGAMSAEAGMSYDQFYAAEEMPDSEEEGRIKVAESDVKGVPVIKREAAHIKARQGKGEKRQKKKEAIAGVSYTSDRFRSVSDMSGYRT